MYTALQYIKDQLKSARETFEGTANDIQPDHLQKDPGGKAFPLGATYAHLVFSEDAIVQGMIQGKAPLSETTWKGKTGTNTPMPAMDQNWEQANEVWSKSVVVNWDELRTYKTAVFAATDTYINSLKDSDLEKVIDLGAWGKKTVAELLGSFIIGHMNSLAGELAVLKGIQGAKGYPF